MKTFSLIPDDKWWGWGERDKFYRIPNPESFWDFFIQKLGELHQSSTAALESIDLPPSKLSAELLSKLSDIVGEKNIGISKEVRLRHSFGKSYKDLIKIRKGDVRGAVDVVVYPGSEDEIVEILHMAQEKLWQIIPSGGGTSVVGGIEPVDPDKVNVAVNLKLMNRVKFIDDISLTVTAQAGISGPSLESELNRRGFTLGHFPQSFEYSTLGGWLAARSAGQKSTKYGKIEHMVQGIRIITLDGEIRTGEVPASATGPDLTQFFVGSEGIFGIITEATLRVSPIPEYKKFYCCLFRSFEDGIDAVRQMVQSEVFPAVIRLSDEEETEMLFSLSEGTDMDYKSQRDVACGAYQQRVYPGGGSRKAPLKGIGFNIIRRFKPIKFYLGGIWIRLNRYSPESSSLLILKFEGSKAITAAHYKTARRIIRRFDHLPLGSSPGRSWERERFEHPYLRDELLNRSIMVDTLETSSKWIGLKELHRNLKGSIRDAAAEAGERCIVAAHLSHAYRTGASLYYTFLMRQEEGKEIRQWERVKRAATDCIIKYRGSLSHHHGIGIDHRDWSEDYLGSPAHRFLRKTKEILDPYGILNPGKIIKKG
ncbi:MAG: FAD-binding oxidoreductase [Fidelibacterota bacterium]